MAEKMTIVKQYEEIIKAVEGVLTEKQIAFLRDRKALHIKKNASKSAKPTARQSENADLGCDILASMESGKAYTISEIMKITPSIAEKALDECSPQRVTAIVSAMVKDNRLMRTVEKGKALFSKP